MVSLYPTYTVTVQDAVNQTARNDLKLFLFEGKVEKRLDPSTSLYKMFQYGTTTLAVQVLAQSGQPEEVYAADPIVRPGEYDFLNINFAATAAGAAGTTLYSVVARPYVDTDFTSASIIVENVALPDPNIKQMLTASYGGAGSIQDNVAWAGGTVAFEQSSVIPLSQTQIALKLNNIPAILTNQVVDETGDNPPGWSNGKKLVVRFDVHYCDGLTPPGTHVWLSLPAYQTPAGAWVIIVKNDFYNVKSTKVIGGGGGETNLGVIWRNFIIAYNLQDTNVHIRRYDNYPVTAISYGTLPFAEMPAIHTINPGGTEVNVGIGSFDMTSHTPSKNLDVFGSSGIRYRDLSGVSHFYINQTSCLISGGSDNSFFDFSAHQWYVRIQADAKFYADTTQTVMSAGYGGGYPYFYANYSEVGLLSNYSYLRLTNGNILYGAVGPTSSPQVFIRVSNTNTIVGFNMAAPWLATGGAHINLSQNVFSVFSNNTRFLYHSYTSGSNASFSIGADTDGSFSSVTYRPYMRGNLDYIYLDGGITDSLSASTTFLRVAPNGFTGYVDDGNTPGVLNKSLKWLSATSNNTTIGYDITNVDGLTKGIIFSNNSGEVSMFAGAVTYLSVTAGVSVTITAAVGVSPTVYIAYSSAYLGWSTTKFYVNNNGDAYIYGGTRRLDVEPAGTKIGYDTTTAFSYLNFASGGGVKLQGYTNSMYILLSDSGDGNLYISNSKTSFICVGGGGGAPGSMDVMVGSLNNYAVLRLPHVSGAGAPTASSASSLPNGSIVSVGDGSACKIFVTCSGFWKVLTPA